MGYRSEVIAVFYCNNPNDYPAMKLFIDENLVDGEVEWVREHVYEEVSGHRKYIRFQVDDVKWYESYSDVQAFNKFVEAFKSLADGEGSTLTWAYEFVRIGEDLGDIEAHESDGADNVLSVSRVVDINI